MLTRRWRVLSRPTILIAFALALSACAGSSSRPHVPTGTAAGYAYYAPGVPYVDDHQRLYIGHVVQPGSWQWISSDTAGRYTFVVRYGAAVHGTLVILRDSKQIETVPDTISGPSFSPDESKVAWVTLAPHDAGTLEIRDVSTLRVLGQLPIVVRPQGTQGISVGLQTDNDGTVHYSSDGQQWWSWRPGRTPLRTPQPDSPTMHSPPGFPGVKALVRLSPDHLWAAWLADDGSRMYFQKPGDPSSRFTIAFPVRVGTGGLLGWDSPSVVGVIDPSSTDGTPRREHCDIMKRACFDGPYEAAP